MNITMADVAREAQTSVATVGRVIHNNGYVSQELRERIENAVASLGYVPNQSARILKSHRSGMIGMHVDGLVIVSDTRITPEQFQMLRKFEIPTVAIECGYLEQETFTFLRGNGGSLPYDVGVYYIAALLALLGPVKSVSAFGAPAKKHEPEFLYKNGDAEPWTIPGINVMSASLRFERGAVASVLFDGNTINAPQHALTLFGSRGILKIGDPNAFNRATTYTES